MSARRRPSASARTSSPRAPAVARAHRRQRPPRRRGRATRCSSDVLVALFAEGHVLIEDLPGVGKTTLARALARSIDLQFARIQCTADLLPADVVGTNVFNQREDRFEFRPGPIFANVVHRRRDQPRVAQDAVGPARVHAGAAGHRRRPHARARAAVPRPRHAEPGRVRGHLPAARGAGRPLHDAAVARLPERARPRPTCSPRHERGDRVAELEPVAERGRRARRPGRRRRASSPPTRCARYVVALLQRTREDPRARARRLAARGPHAAARRQGARAAARAATTRCPTTSRRSPQPVLAHRIVLAPEAVDATPAAGRRRRAGGDAGAVAPMRPAARRSPRLGRRSLVLRRGRRSTPSRCTSPAVAFVALARRRVGVGRGSPRAASRVERARSARGASSRTSRSTSASTSAPGALPLPGGVLDDALLGDARRRCALGARGRRRADRRALRAAAGAATLAPPRWSSRDPLGLADARDRAAAERRRGARAAARRAGPRGRRRRRAARGAPRRAGRRSPPRSSSTACASTATGTPASRIYWPALARGARADGAAAARRDRRARRSIVLDARGAGGASEDARRRRPRRAPRSRSRSRATAAARVLLPGDRRADGARPSRSAAGRTCTRASRSSTPAGGPPLSGSPSRVGPVIYVAARAPGAHAARARARARRRPRRSSCRARCPAAGRRSRSPAARATTSSRRATRRRSGRMSARRRRPPPRDPRCARAARRRDARRGSPSRAGRPRSPRSRCSGRRRGRTWSGPRRRGRMLGAARRRRRARRRRAASHARCAGRRRAGCVLGAVARRGRRARRCCSPGVAGAHAARPDAAGTTSLGGLGQAASRRCPGSASRTAASTSGTGSRCCSAARCSRSPAPLLACWPGRAGRPAARRVAAVLLVGAVRGPGGPARASTTRSSTGMIFALLLAAVLFAERLPPREAPVAVPALVAVAALVGVALAPRLDATGAVDRLRVDRAVARRARHDARSRWDHRYGPLDWPRDGREVLRIRAPTQRVLEGDDARRTSTACAGARRSPQGIEDDPAAEAPNPRWVQDLRVSVRNLRTTQFVAAGHDAAHRRARRAPVARRARRARSSTGDRPLRRGARVPGRASTSRGRGARSSTRPGTDYPTSLCAVPVDAAARARRRADRDRPATRRAGPRRAGGVRRLRRVRRRRGRRSALRGPRLRRAAAARSGSQDSRLRAHVPRSPGGCAAQSTTPYDFVRRVQHVPRSAASPTPRRRPQRPVPLDAFLFRDKVGYCQQFSGRDGAAAADGRRARPRGDRLHAGHARPRRATSTSCATSTRTRGSRRTSRATAG